MQPQTQLTQPQSSTRTTSTRIRLWPFLPISAYWWSSQSLRLRNRSLPLPCQPRLGALHRVGCLLDYAGNHQVDYRFHQYGTAAHYHYPGAYILGVYGIGHHGDCQRSNRQGQGAAHHRQIQPAEVGVASASNTQQQRGRPQKRPSPLLYIGDCS